jgi:hypothetical protein
MFEEVRKCVEVKFKADWPGLSTNVPYVFDNVPVPTPQPKTFVRVSLRMGRPVNHTIGTRRIPKHPGVLFCQIFTPKNDGSAPSRRLADFAKSIFEFQQFRQGNVTVDFGEPGELQEVGDRADYYQENLIMRLVAHEVV